MICALPVRAVIIRYSVEQLCAGSEKIVIGEVTDMESRYLEPGAAIHTFVTIYVDEVLKGEQIDEEIILRVPGGTVGSSTMVVSHAPYFEIGEQVLVFTAHQVDGAEIVYNAENGKYTIEKGIILEKEVPLDNFKLVIQAYLDSSQ
jgi:hypothetical protein